MADQERQGKMGGVVPNDRTLRNTFGLFFGQKEKKGRTLILRIILSEYNKQQIC